MTKEPERGSLQGLCCAVLQRHGYGLGVTTMKPPKRIPVAAAKRYGEEQRQDQVIVLSFGNDGVTHIVSWGRTKKDCEQASVGALKVTEFFGLVDGPLLQGNHGVEL